jgi:hypothetical protein
MPRLNRLGQWCAGIGGIEVSAEPYGVIASPAGCAAWKDDQTVVFSHRVSLPDTWGLAERSATGTTPIAGSGAQWMEAGGGIWAAGIAGGGPRVWTSDGRTFPGAAILCVGDDGALVLRPNYFATLGARIVHRDGTTEDLPIICRSPQRVGSGMVYVDEHSQVRAWNLRQPVQAPGAAFSPRILTTPDGALWLLVVRTEAGRERLILHPWDSLDGYVILENPTLFAYRHDGIAVSQTAARVVWATNEDETYASLCSTMVDLTAPRVDLSVPYAPPVVAIPSAPANEESMHPPGIDVTFGGVIQKGRVWRTVLKDRNNPGNEIDLMIDASGNFTAKWINPAGSNQTGAVRKAL